MGCIDACCWGPFGARCCNIISIVGFVYFALNFIIFPQQKNFYEFHMQNPDDTRWSFFICAILYLFFFAITFYRIHELNKQKDNMKKDKVSIHDSPQLMKMNSNSNININKGDSEVKQMKE